MKKLIILAVLGLVTALPALAQRDDSPEGDRRYCASGRSGVDFNTCMWRMQRDREQRYDRREQRAYEREQRRDYERRERWAEQPPPPPAYRQWDGQQGGGEQPRLSDMQQRALDNCNLLAPRDQPRCRATVMSTVR